MGKKVSPPYIGLLMRKKRESVPLTRGELARKAGVSAETIKKIETGRTRAPRPETATVLATVLKMEAELLSNPAMARTAYYLEYASRDAGCDDGQSADASNRVRFYQAQTISRIYDWKLDQHWKSFDELVEICVAPNLLEPETPSCEGGWRTDQFILCLKDELETIPTLNVFYNSWYSTVDKHKQKCDGRKYTLANNPSSETDEHFVKVWLKTTQWSRVQSFLHQIKEPDNHDLMFHAADPSHSQDSKPLMDFESNRIPHAFCLHGIIVTSDMKVLAVQRPGFERTDYRPLAWSLSFEEQLSDKDFGSKKEIDASGWVIRAVRQEMIGEQVDRYLNIDKVRILTIGNEVPIYNPFVVAYIPLECDSRQLAQLLVHAPDRAEWNNYAFLDLSFPCHDLVAMFRKKIYVDGGQLHPTTRYRIFWLLHTIFQFHQVDVPSFLMTNCKHL